MELPPSVVLELTYKCNHRCIFCSCPWDAPHSKYPKGKELCLDEWKTAIDKLYRQGIQSFSISGGEAILKDCMPEIVEYIHNEGLKRDINNPIVLISNGLAMKDEYLHLFKKCNVHLSMSLPGYSTFKEHTGVDNADGVLGWFEKAKTLGLDTTVNVTVTQKNFHELFETISMGLISGASSVLLNRFLPGGRGLSYMNELMLTPEQVNSMLDTAEEVLTISNRYGNLGTEVAYCAIKQPQKYQRMQIGYQCAAAKVFFVIDPSGNIRTCNHSPRIVGHIFKEPMIEDLDYWNLFAKSECKPTMCSGCKNIFKCDCGCREVANILYGSPEDIDTSIISRDRVISK
jgi:radical SAM protein with 4Fe4S-binding SPASM domain